MNAAYYSLSSYSMDPCDLTDEEYERAAKSWLCMGCFSPKPTTTGLDVSLAVLPGKSPIDFINGCGLGIAHKDFLFRFGKDVVRDHLYLGKIFGPDGVLLNDWVTFVGRYKIITRGSKNVSVRRCSECGRIVYFAMGRLYLHPAPPQGPRIFDEGDGGLVVTADLFERINSMNWHKLNCRKLPILAFPRDGLGDLSVI